MKAHAKANVFLKLTGFDERNYHILNSRFVLLDEIYDEIELTKDKKREGFEIISEFQCQNNLIAKAHALLCECGFANALNECFKDYAVKLNKRIPLCAGLGGGSTDAACFLTLINESLNLGLSRENLTQIGFKLGSDVPFFLSGFKSANVSGTGEIIAEFTDEIPPLNFTFSQCECLSASVYAEFDKGEFDFSQNAKFAKEFEKKSSKELLNAYENTLLNDLFAPCVRLYPTMSAFLEQGFFLSGSGSAVFKVGK